MKFEFSQGALRYLQDRHIDEIFIRSVLKMSGCCAVPRNFFEIYTKRTDGNFQNLNQDGININYDSNMKRYFGDTDTVNINIAGIGPIKTLYVPNEVNILKEDAS